MTNFDPSKHENAMNPYTLSPEKQEKVMDIVDDSRLTNPSGDYFKLKLDDETIDIPKLENISKETKEGKIISISTAAYIKRLLKDK